MSGGMQSRDDVVLVSQPQCDYSGYGWTSTVKNYRAAAVR